MKSVKRKKGTVLTAASGALTVIICAVMNLITIPHIESVTQGIRCFDMNPGYTYEAAEKFISLLGDMRDYYLHVQLPLDFVYPVVYTVFFILLLVMLTGRFMPLCLLPLALAAFDFTENILTIVMLKSAVLSRGVVAFASAVTSIKTILMYSVFAIIIVCISFRIVKRRKG